jgi:Glycosyl transferase family 2
MTGGDAGATSDAVPPAERVAVVVVTYNRAELLVGMLDGLAEQTRPPDAVIVVNNASSDHTRGVLDERDDLPLQAIHSLENLGGAGGFHRGVAEAYAQDFDRIWLMDDDVVPAPDCLETLLRHDLPCLMAVREDRRGTLVEKSALHFDLRNPLALRPKRASVDSTFRTRAEMPELVPVEVIAFEGFLVRRDVIGFRTRRTSSSTTTPTTRFEPGRPGSASTPFATPCSCANSTSTSSTTSALGRAGSCTATCSSCTSGTGRTPWCEPSPTSSPPVSWPSARCARTAGARWAT